jgi:hypothetical protein
VDPDPHGSAFILLGWIRIRNQDGKNYQQNEEIFKFEVLDVPFVG